MPKFFVTQDKISDNQIIIDSEDVTHISTHSSQIKAPSGPAISLLTWSSVFPQKEQLNFSLLIFAINTP